MTQPGERIAAHALRVLREVQNIKRMSEEFKHEDRGALAIGTTHTQARYVHLTRRAVDRAVECQTPESVAALFAREALPVR